MSTENTGKLTSHQQQISKDKAGGSVYQLVFVVIQID